MYCPICDEVRMKEVEKDGVLIDVCPNCKGMWLDRGELDKLSRRVQEVRRPFNDWYDDDDEHNARHDKERDRHYHDQRNDRDDYVKGKYPRRKKKKSVMDMLGDIFD
ncbi:zf-TFIIB domain-containing protein [Sporolactobacillus terrae]|uniref:Transcription factor zinc-finger domain-containing protein n=1 Tax=Sporolactobacillus terrae TaxID=269673 RepID=A0A410DAI0_9BACL|nr:zf-TFIIB domain-containing protein [Sporolactobacillus terrae]QAA23121.1 hypothetical protein C0674_11045 [Sporolactobacillus terrae]QAA26091.1 hypothetical protein C0679_11025 [Sporolactobacillus terrae]UAK17972.1 zf-TFIIB domain-containing protein [Sporolactobacillus terrae]BBN99537.1 hypothetical protein St703_22420 [Sporolactobacillus terrae]